MDNLTKQLNRMTIPSSRDGRHHKENCGSYHRTNDAWNQHFYHHRRPSPPLTNKFNQRHLRLELVGELSKEQANQFQQMCEKEDSIFHKKLEHFGVFDKIDFSYKITVEHRIKGPCIEYILVLRTPSELYYGQKRKFRSIFDNRKSMGFTEWLGGATGWRFHSTPDNKWKRGAVFKLNTLQSVFTLFAPDEQKYLFPNESKKLAWKKQTELTSAVSDIRVWIESINPTSLTRRLLKSSNDGPNAPVNWAHHHPMNSYPLTVVTEKMMDELVDGVISLFLQHFEHTQEKPLGKTWRSNPQRRLTDWKDTGADFPEWTEDLLERKLNGRFHKYN
jgi:hypothetical protein